MDSDQIRVAEADELAPKDEQAARNGELPDDLRDLPEFQDAAAWRAGVFAFAECIIAEQTADVPEGVLMRLDALADRWVIGARCAALARAWSGVSPGDGVHGGGMLRLIRSIGRAPAAGENLTEWWIRQSAPESDDDIDRMEMIFDHWSYTGGQKNAPVSVAVLGECERALMQDAATGLPGVVETYDALAALDSTPVTNGKPRLSAVAARVNVMRSYARRAGAKGAAFERVGIGDVVWELGAAGRETYLDCGHIRDAEELREVIASLSVSGLGFSFCAACAAPGNVVWHAKTGSFGWDGYRWCGGCATYDTRGPSPVGVRAPSGAYGGDVRFDLPAEELAPVALAIALRCSPADAADLLADRVDRADIGGVRCPRLSECDTSCGALQRRDDAMVAIAASGDLDRCARKSYLDQVEGVEDAGERWRIALPLIKAAKGEESSEPDPAAAVSKPKSGNDMQGALL